MNDAINSSLQLYQQQKQPPSYLAMLPIFPNMSKNSRYDSHPNSSAPFYKNSACIEQQHKILNEETGIQFVSYQRSRHLTLPPLAAAVSTVGSAVVADFDFKINQSGRPPKK